jgi:hypothetical protein
VDDILSAMTATYGSLTKPNFRLVAERLEQQLYAELVDGLAGHFAVDDHTDPNDDHGYSLTLSRAGNTWSLLLSVVGPYAAFGRVDKAWDAILTDATPDLTDDERWVLYRLRQSGTRALSQAELEEHVDLPLFNTQPGEVRVYHALFCDIPGLPWDKETLRRLGLLDG